MGTDIGVVTIEYLERPDEPVYGFIQELPSLLDSDNSSWSGAWEGNFFLQTDRQRLLAASRYYAASIACPPTSATSWPNGSTAHYPGRATWLCCTWIGDSLLL